MKISKKLRNNFADCSTGSAGGKYYESKGEAVNKFDSVLNDYGFELDSEPFNDYNGDEGRACHNILVSDSERKVVAGIAYFFWFRMDSGRYEFIGLIG